MKHSNSSNRISVDLISDTVTQPTPSMREAMCHAHLGDEQRGEDPSTRLLCDIVCDELGKEDGLLLPSGVMCNLISILVHCQPGDEIIADSISHIVSSEGAGASAIAGVSIRAVSGRAGIFNDDDIINAIRPIKRNAPRTSLLVVEQTVNRAGGIVWPLEDLKSIAQTATCYGLATHLDGARILNAAVALGVSPKRLACYFDSVWLDLSKGLACPVGAVLTGSSEFIEKAWIWKHRLGGAMRQSGVLAAAGIYALKNNVARLSEDHDNARLFSELIANINGITIDQSQVDTNIVFLNTRDTGFKAEVISRKLLEYGVRIGFEGNFRMRAVTHMGVNQSDIKKAADVLRHIVNGLKY